MKTRIVLGISVALAMAGVGNAHAGGGKVNADGTIDLVVNFRVPPTAGVVDTTKQQLERASRLVCDATDGQLRLGLVTLTAGTERLEDGDIWIYPNSSRAFSSGALGHGVGHVSVFGYSSPDLRDVRERLSTSVRGDVLAHELGHLVFGLGDQYSEQVKSFGCGTGPSFDGSGALRDWRPPSSSLDVFDPTHTERNHTIMQQLGSQVCRRPKDLKSPFEVDPDRYAGYYRCLQDSDCTDPVPRGWGFPSAPSAGGSADELFTLCAEEPLQMSELTVADNFDALTVASERVNYCPAPQEARELMVRGSFPAWYNFGLVCGNGRIDDAIGEECDGSGVFCTALGPQFTGGFARCASCLLDKSGCVLASPTSCGLAEPGPEHECSPSRDYAWCSELHPRLETDGFEMTCNANCTWDRARCRVSPSNRFDTLSFAAIRKTPNSLTWDTVVMDAVGDAKDGTSLHALTLHATKYSEHEWTLLVSVPPEDYEGMGGCEDGIINGNAGENCENARTAVTQCARVSDLTDGLASCHECRWDLSACTAPSTCGNGVVDTVEGEQCDGAISGDCSLADENLVGTLACNSNCTFDQTNCKPRGVMIVGNYSLRFDPANGRVTHVNGRPYDAASPPADLKLILGSPDEGAPYGRLPDGSPGGSNITGAFKRRMPGRDVRHPPVRLRLDFSGLVEETFTNEFGKRGYAASAYARHGLSPAGEDSPQLGWCEQHEHCAVGYNKETQRFESTAHFIGEYFASDEQRKRTLLSTPEEANVSDWEVLARNMRDRWSFPVDLPTDRPDPRTLQNPTFNCSPPTFLETDLQEPTEVVLVLDRSGSMNNNDAGFERATRVDFAKAAARLFIDLHSRRTDKPRVGVVWFSSTSERFVGQPPGLDSSGSATVNRLPRLLRGECGTDPAGPRWPCRNLEQEVGHEDVFNVLRGSDDVDGQYPLADGTTDIGAGLQTAFEMFPRDPSSTGPRAVVLLTDGANNYGGRTPEPGVTIEPSDVAAQMAAAQIKLYTVPSGPAADRWLSSTLASATRGEMLDATDDARIPDQFFQVYARTRGEALLETSTEASALIREFWKPVDVGLQVEVGAEKLNVVLTSNAAVAADPSFTLFDPDGEPVNEGPDVSVSRDRFYQLVRVNRPKAGKWIARSDLIRNLDRNEQFFSAHVENAKPNCFVTLSKAEGGKDLKIEASAYYERDIRRGATFTGRLQAPGNKIVPLRFAPQRDQSAQLATVAAADMPYSGRYDVHVRCDVERGAELVEGESIYADLPAAPKGTVQAFVRNVSESFALRGLPWPPPTGTDEDGDGIPNAQEPPGDTDGDGVPDVYDADADNDDVPDAIDPDPKNPNVPRPPRCTQTPEPIACCSNIGACAGTEHYAVYASGALELADRARVLNEGGGAGGVVNAGSTATQFGANSRVGSAWSRASVTARERATIDGSLSTAGTLTRQNGVTITGTLREQAALTFPDLARFQIGFPTSNQGSWTIEPDRTLDLAPGSYGTVSVKSRSTLRLRTGTYFFEGFHVLEPDAQVTFDTSAGEAFLYVKSALTYRGAFRASTGRHDQVLLAYFGTNTAVIEAPFSGTLVAPLARIKLGMSHKGPHYGAFFGRDVQLDADAVVAHRPFKRAWALGSMRFNSLFVEVQPDAATQRDGAGCACTLPAGASRTAPVSTLLGAGLSGLLWVARRKRRTP